MKREEMKHRGTERTEMGRLLAVVMCLLLCGVLGCPAAPESSGLGKLDHSKPKTLRGLFAQRLADERSERADLSASIAADIRSGKLKEPAQYGEAWNRGDAAIGKKTSETVSELLKQGFAKAPHDRVWDELSKGYRP
jgi:hypothetical protein